MSVQIGAPRPGRRGRIEHQNCYLDQVMKLILTRKLADSMDGVDVSRFHVGDVIDLPPREADVLIAEGWVVRDRRTEAVGTRTIERRQSTRRLPPDTLEEHLNKAS